MSLFANILGRESRLRETDTSVPSGQDSGFSGHLKELRSRAVLGLLGVLAGTIVGWALYDPIFQALQQPMLAAGEGSERIVALNFAGVGAAFSTKLKVSVFVGVVLSFPWWIYQILAFVWPGLVRREQRIVLILGIATVPLFLTGVFLAWFFVPLSIEVLTGFAPDFTATMVNAEVYFDFVLKMLLAFGVAFLLPLVMVGLMGMGIVPAHVWLGQWRWAVLLSFLFAAVASPSGDILTMSGLGLPIVMLYFSAVGIGYLWELHQLRAYSRLNTDS
ncbi:twin-arginine translocase subunit TatC [Jonesiaceae bacterium BS-20]|uniref:Sec-independent protein translocase protein TatC n=1 Tax=Jonesiaceae bacterium BS-20 TaxID=3120821 RepID=A0AAU7DUW4_9MICO